MFIPIYINIHPIFLFITVSSTIYGYILLGKINVSRLFPAPYGCTWRECFYSSKLVTGNWIANVLIQALHIQALQKSSIARKILGRIDDFNLWSPGSSILHVLRVV